MLLPGSMPGSYAPASGMGAPRSSSAGMHALLGSASERAKGRGAVWAKSGHVAQYYYDILLARLGAVWEMAKGQTQVLEAEPIDYAIQTL